MKYILEGMDIRNVYSKIFTIAMFGRNFVMCAF